MDCFMEGMDEYLIDKLEVCEGDVSLLKDRSNRYIALITNKDENGEYFIDENAPKIGDIITIAEEKAESYLHRFSEEDSSITYESKAVKRAEFEDFKKMFTLLGGVLCLIIGFVGVLNFFNTVMAGIIARKNEIAVLQAIGMTGKQVKEMLIIEGMIYTVGSGLLALILSLIFIPVVNGIANSIFWFYSNHFYHLSGEDMAPPDYQEIDFVCKHEDGSLETPATISDACRSASKHIPELEGFHFHMLRHTYTTNIKYSDKKVFYYILIGIYFDLYPHGRDETKRDNVSHGVTIHFIPPIFLPPNAF